MALKHKVAQLYGYLVCLVAIITFLIGIGNIVAALFDLSDPLHAKNFGTPSLASFETYKMDVLGKQPAAREGAGAGQAYVPDEQTLKAMYDAAKDERISNIVHESRKNITINVLLILFAAGLFTFHWLWTRRIMKEDVSAV